MSAKSVASSNSFFSSARRLRYGLGNVVEQRARITAIGAAGDGNEAAVVILFSADVAEGDELDHVQFPFWDFKKGSQGDETAQCADAKTRAAEFSSPSGAIALEQKRAFRR